MFCILALPKFVHPSFHHSPFTGEVNAHYELSTGPYEPNRRYCSHGVHTLKIYLHFVYETELPNS